MCDWWNSNRYPAESTSDLDIDSATILITMLFIPQYPSPELMSPPRVTQSLLCYFMFLLQPQTGRDGTWSLFRKKRSTWDERSSRIFEMEVAPSFWYQFVDQYSFDHRAPPEGRDPFICVIHALGREADTHHLRDCDWCDVVKSTLTCDCISKSDCCNHNSPRCRQRRYRAAGASEMIYDKDRYCSSRLSSTDFIIHSAGDWGMSPV